MWKYNHTDELYHYGVPGMKWGRRKTVPLVNKNLHKRKNMSTEELRVANAKAAYKTARKQANRDFNDAYNKSIASWSPVKKHRDADKARWEKAYDSEVARDKAKASYKKAKVDLTKSRVKAYKESVQKKDELYKKGDKEMEKAKALYVKTGKNAVDRIINNIKGESDAVKTYTKQFNKASKIYDEADAEWLKSEELYKKTGKSRITRKINTGKY